jgi:hypothetical protein
MGQREEASDNNQSDKRLIFVFSIQQNANGQFAVIKDRSIVQPLKNQSHQCGVQGTNSFFFPQTFRGTLWPKPPLSSGASIKAKGPNSRIKPLGPCDRSALESLEPLFERF